MDCILSQGEAERNEGVGVFATCDEINSVWCNEEVQSPSVPIHGHWGPICHACRVEIRVVCKGEGGEGKETSKLSTSMSTGEGWMLRLSGGG